MLKLETLNTLISQYYDNEMNESELLAYEARIAVSKGIKDYTNEQCFEYFKISNSIKLVKNRAKKRQKNICEEKFFKKRGLIFNFNAITSKCFNKHLRNIFLNIKRNDSK